MSVMRHRVVVIGSGFGGLFAARKLARTRANVTLISRTSHHLFQPLLYQVATGILSEGTIAPTTRDLLTKQRNATVFLGEVTEIDVAERTVTAQARGQQQTHAYDSLIVAAGAGQSYFGNDHFAIHAPGLKSIDDALELRSRIFNAFELAEVAANEGRRDDVRKLLTFVVAGAGPTGVEMAGQIAELARRLPQDGFRAIGPGDCRVLLVDGSDAVLGTFGSDLSGKAQQKLRELGIEVRLKTFVVDVDADSVTMKDTDGNTERLETVCKVWAAGVAGSPLGKQLAEQTGATVDKAGRVEVLPDLTLPGHPEIFVLGDMISLKGYPGVAPLAIQTGKFAARQIKRMLAGKRRDPEFVYKDKGSMATISRFSAITKIGKIELYGFTAWIAWLVLHLLYIIGFKNQVTTLLSWFVTFVGNERSERANSAEQAVSRSRYKASNSDEPVFEVAASS